jgi:hypothetical protein
MKYIVLTILIFGIVSCSEGNKNFNNLLSLSCKCMPNESTDNTCTYNYATLKVDLKKNTMTFEGVKHDNLRRSDFFYTSEGWPNESYSLDRSNLVFRHIWGEFKEGPINNSYQCSKVQI